MATTEIVEVREAPRKVGHSRALVKYQEETSRLRARLSNIRQRGDQEAAQLEQGASMLVAAYLFGSWEKKERDAGRTLATVGGLEPAIAWSVGGYVAGRFVGGRMGEILQSAALGVASGYAYNRGSTGSSGTSGTPAAR